MGKHHSANSEPQHFSETIGYTKMERLFYQECGSLNLEEKTIESEQSEELCYS